MTDAQTPSMAEQLLSLATGLWTTQAIYIVAELRIADLLHENPKTCDDLAKASSTNPEALYRIMRALAGNGIFAEGEDGVFNLTPLAELLRADAPGSLRPFILLLGSELQWKPWAEAMHSVKSGKPAFDHVFGKPHFKYFSEHPDAARSFNEAMTSRSGPEDTAILSHYDFSGSHTIVDVGGGHGSFLGAILDRYSGSRGILFDMPHVVSTARDHWKNTPLAERLSYQGGDFFDSVPAGGDVYIIKKVIHNWDDAGVISILSRCRESMKVTGKLLVIEPVVPPGNTASFNKMLDLMMLIWTSMGKERTETEHRDLMQKAGFRLERAIHTDAMVTVLEATPI
jgi:hypothetical protein